MEIGEQYGQPELQQFLAVRSRFPAIQNPPEILGSHGFQYQALLSSSFSNEREHQKLINPSEFYGLLGDQLSDVHNQSVVLKAQQMITGTTNNNNSNTNVFSESPSSMCGPSSPSSIAKNHGGGGGGGFGGGVIMGGGGEEGEEGGGGCGRWPRQETLRLLEVRSQMDVKFREATHKGPLWDEVARILAEEHGYQRTGKKCREKFENLYKYYKKTKEGKAGRQDGKHYRFFTQLDALCGEIPARNGEIAPKSLEIPAKIAPPTINRKQGESPSSSDNWDWEEREEEEGREREEMGGGLSSSSGGSEMKRKREKVRRKRGWRWKRVKVYVEMQMKRLAERQEAWVEEVVRVLEKKERERMWREEEWRRQERERLERECEVWARERECMEARDKALMEALQRIASIHEPCHVEIQK